MKVLAVHRYYWPDTAPYASILRAIVRQWVQDGHDVDVLSSQPSYKPNVALEKRLSQEVVDGATITRLNLPAEAGKPLMRILNAVRLGCGLFWMALIKRRYDVVMISTYPPVLGGYCAALVAKLTGARFIYHCMDIQPEIGKVSGEFRQKHIYTILRKLDEWTCNQAKPVVVLSEDMSATLNARNGSDSINSVVLNNFSLPEDGSIPTELPFDWPSEKFVLLFAGNVGRFQGLESLMAAMAMLKHRVDIRLLVMGDGSEKVYLERKAMQDGSRVSFVGHHTVGVAKLAMQYASAGFVSLTPDLYKYAYPSKTVTYLERGCPVIVAVEPESRLSKNIISNSLGVCVPPGDPVSIAHEIEFLTDNPAILRDLCDSVALYSSTELSMNDALGHWSDLLRNG